MIQLKSVVDGLNIILGSPIVNLACLLTLLLAIRGPPSYPDDPERDTNAKVTYSMLVLLHACLTFVKTWSLFVSRFFWDKQTLLTLITVVLAANICVDWLFGQGPSGELTLDQTRFQHWLLVEMALLVGYVLSGVFYAFLAKLKHPTV